MRLRNRLLVALLVSLTLLGAGAVAARAAPAVQDAPRLGLGAAVAVGLLYYLSVSPWLADLGFGVFYRPLMAGTLVGLVMGQPGRGIAVGAQINVLYLGWVGAGGALPGDPGLAGYLGTALALGGGLDSGAALALAAPLGLLGGLTWSLRMSLSSVFAHWADRRAEEADVGGVVRSNVLYPQILVFLLYAVPVALAAYLGAPAVAGALNWVDAEAGWLLSGLYAAGGMLGALGIALTLTFLFRGGEWPYFFVGFVLVSLLGEEVNMVALALLAGAVAYLHVLFTGGFEPEGEALRAPPEEREAPGLLTRRDLFGAWLRWLFFSHASYNWERLQGLGFAHAMAPVIRKLYRTEEEVRAALQRHLVFFNTQPDVGGLIGGVVIAMEEERAAGAAVTGDAINSVKTGLMGPLGGVGDALVQGVVLPVTISIAMNLAVGGEVTEATVGNPLGPLFLLVAVAAVVWVGGWFIWWQGYLRGREAVGDLVRRGGLGQFVKGAGVVGNFVIGALTVSFVSVTTPVALTIGGGTFEVQPLIDALMPNLLPLALVLGIWWLLARRRARPTWVMVAILALALAGAYPIWPGVDPETGELIRVGLFGP